MPGISTVVLGKRRLGAGWVWELFTHPGLLYPIRILARRRPMSSSLSMI